MTRNAPALSRWLGAALLAFTVAACGGGGDSGGTTTTVGSTAAAATDQPTTSATPDTAAPTDAPTTTAAPVPVYPLTGLPVTDPAVAARPALVVKIDNNAAARPQSGLNEADIVFEEIVEIGTRFAAVLHSQTADPVGPIRSGRTQDVDLLGSLNHPLFMWSGGNPYVTKIIKNSDFVDLSAQIGDVYRGAGFYRSDKRKGPHDLYAQSSMAWTLAPAGAGPPAQQFQYLPAGQQAAGDPATGVDGQMDDLKIEWRYDAGSGHYLRSNGGKPHNDELSGQVSTENVIVMTVPYKASAADPRSPEAQTIGTGEVMVFTGGKVIQGTWSRADRLSPIVLTDANGQPILLTPGRSFIELAKADTFHPVA